MPGLPEHPIARWQQHKIILAHAAKVSRDELAAKHDREGLVTSQSLSTILNMVWNNDVKLFNKIYAGSITVRENVRLKSGTLIFIVSVKFDKLFANAKTVELEAKIVKLTSKPSSRKRRKKIAVSSRLLKLWSPFHSRLRIVGVLDNGGTKIIASDHCSFSGALLRAMVYASSGSPLSSRGSP